MKSKFREFWCRFQHDDRDRATTFVKRELCEHLSSEYWDDEIIHTREVSPEYDVLVERMASLILYATSIMSKNSSAVSLFESECKSVLAKLEAFKAKNET